MHVDKIAGDTFDAIVELFPKIIPDAKINSSGWWSLLVLMENPKSNLIPIDHWEFLILNMLTRNQLGIFQCV